VLDEVSATHRKNNIIVNLETRDQSQPNISPKGNSIVTAIDAYATARRRSSKLAAMAPSRRIPSNGHISVQNSHSHANSSRQSKAQRHRSQPSISATHPEQPNLGMSPASRYNHNLKVLRRRDPSIVSIFDQFSHVCVYHHNGKKWEKQGFEGSMFLYER